MSPILIAILAVFCCIVGFVMGRVTARTKLVVADSRQIAALSRMGIAASKSGFDVPL